MSNRSVVVPENSERPELCGSPVRFISSSTNHPVPVRLLIMTILPIFIAEILIVVMLKRLPDLPLFANAVIDASVLTILAFPALYAFLFQPLGLEIARLRQAETDIKIQTSAINATTDQVVITDLLGRIRFVNPAFEKENGYSFAEVVGQNPRILKSGQHDDDFYRKIWITIISGNTWQGEITNRRKDGSLYTEDTTITPIKNEAGEIEHFVAIKRDITKKNRMRQEILDHLAYHDSLTGLPNRLMFSHRLTQSLSRAEQQGTCSAVMFLDLDRFKMINDTLGHNLGDLLLAEVAKRLKITLRGVGTIARMGGDEFTVILTDVKSTEDATAVAKKTLDAISKPIILDEREIFITASIGIAFYPLHGGDAETLVRKADTAMYKAKEQGKNTFCLYSYSLSAAAMQKMTLEAELRRALEKEELTVYYQPVVNLSTGNIIGTEALVRWQHPRLGLVSPDCFIPLAEETGLIVPIGEWVLRTACAQNKAWQDAGAPLLSVAVNVSARQFLQGNLAATVKELLEETGLEAKYLELELTEGSLVQDVDAAATALRQLKEMGIKVSIDDFGMGYSSLGRLKRFPVNTVKIDRAFVRNIITSPDDAAIAGAVVAMAHSLKLRVIAEGVETLEQLEFLKSLNCDEMQGYFISAPVPANDLIQLVQETKREPEDDLYRAA